MSHVPPLFPDDAQHLTIEQAREIEQSAAYLAFEDQIDALVADLVAASMSAIVLLQAGDEQGALDIGASVQARIESPETELVGLSMSLLGALTALTARLQMRFPKVWAELQSK